MEMGFFWLLDQNTQEYFKFYYLLGLECLADYPSKSHTGYIHNNVRPYFIPMKNSPRAVAQAAKHSSRRWCAEILGDLYHKKIPLPRIPYIHEPDLTSLSSVSAAAVPAATVEYPRRSPTCEWTVELSRIMISYLRMQISVRMLS